MCVVCVVCARMVHGPAQIHSAFRLPVAPAVVNMNCWMFWFARAATILFLYVC